MVDTVVTLATNYGQEAKPENDIGTISRDEASKVILGLSENELKFLDFHFELPDTRSILRYLPFT